MRVLTWNLMHGRAVPPARRDLFEEFAAALGAWDWDVALLQEVPPWWPERLALQLGGDHRLAPTSRNALLPLRRALAVRWPDVIKSNGGGCNAILVRSAEIAEHRVARLRRLPERRWVHGVRLAEPGVWIANLHGQGAERDARSAARIGLAWAGASPLVLGGDFNRRSLFLDGFDRAGGHEVDQVFVRGLAVPGEAVVLDRGRLSDHAPVLVRVGVRASSE